MPLNSPNDGIFDGLPNNIRWVLDLQERLEATINPLGKLQKQLDVLAKLPGIVPPPAWLDTMQLDHLARFPKQLDEVFQKLALQTQHFDKLAKLTTLPQLPAGLLDQMASLGVAQTQFFDKWSSLAVAFERPQWLEKLESIQNRFDERLAALAAAPVEDETAEVESSVLLSAEVFALGNDVLAMPDAIGSSQIQAVLAACNRLLAAAISPKAKELVRDLLMLLTFIALAHDQWKAAHPVAAAPTTGEVLLHKDAEKEHLQAILLATQRARAAGQLLVATRTIRLNSRPAAKALAVGKLPAGTELTPTGQVRAWVHVSGFDVEGELVEGWALAVYLAPSELKTIESAGSAGHLAHLTPAVSTQPERAPTQKRPRRARKTSTQ